MQKLLILICVYLFSTLVAIGQTQKEADDFFKQRKYQEALNIYKSLNNSSYEVKKKMAYSLKKLYRYKEAQEVYENIINVDNVDDETYFNYSDILNTLEDYSKAIEYYSKITEKNKGTLNIEKRIESCIWAKEHPNNISKFKLLKTNVETGGLSFGVAPRQDGIVYSTLESINTAEETKFYNLVFSKKEGETSFSAPTEFSKNFNTIYYEGSPSFHNDVIFFTRNASEKEKIKLKKHKKFKVSSTGVNKLKIYSSKSESGEWTDPEALSFNNNEFSCTHPSISQDGKTLYFASDMPGGFGGYDIYVVTKNNLGTWSNPKNLGSDINTKANEMFPFIIASDLYFSSRGHKGYGGADVFVTTSKDGDWTFPKNMGLGVNSSKDDFSFVLNNNQKSGYMSSNREGNNGYDYIYVIKPAMEMDSVLTFVENSFDGKSVAAPFVIVKNEDIGENTIQGEDGKVMTVGPKNKPATYTFDADGYAPKTISLDKLNKTKLSEIILDPLLRGTVTNSITNEAMEGVKVYAVDKLTGERVGNMVTGKDGKWAFVLPEDREFDIYFEKDGFQTKAVNVKANERGDEIRATLNGVELDPAIDKGSKFEIRNIYFEFSKSRLKPEAHKTLDNLVKFLNANPDVRIELSAHTDMFGKDRYNEKLSDKRAKSAAEYLFEHGISKQRVKAIGYGEKYILNRCTSYIKKCTEEEHAINRRVEVKIL
jgi:outer membrane protein OmpA-like peptidoglycan-associated protein/tetratricopeptide (TPR) repeat protein